MSDWLEIFNAYRAPAQHLASVLLAAAIWRWGGSPERWLIGIFICTMVLPVWVLRWLGYSGALEVGPTAVIVMLIDLCAAILFVGVALRANRNYPLWIAGFQLVALGAHMVNMITDSVSPLAIALLAIGPSYCQLLLLLAGFVRHTRRERRFGHYRAWRIAAPAAGGLAL
jgi:hypothetical protein